jgi:hypothetical protein
MDANTLAYYQGYYDAYNALAAAYASMADPTTAYYAAAAYDPATVAYYQGAYDLCQAMGLC